MPLKIIFAGTPEFAVPTLAELIASQHALLAVYTQPDRPAGRGRQLQASPVKVLTQSHHIPVFQPTTLRDLDAQNQLRDLKPDVMVVVAYGLILPQAVLDIPRLGCMNVHPSLLPRWRGAAPIQRMLEAGDKESGVTIMQMEKGMDTGSILKQAAYLLQGDETAAELHELYSYRGAQLLLETLEECEQDMLSPITQTNAQATYANKINKQEVQIEWCQSAVQIARKIRAFNSWPVAQTQFDAHVLRIWQAQARKENAKYSPGTLVTIENDKIIVATGEGVLEIMTVQLSGKKQMSVIDFVHGYKNALIPGKTHFGEK